VTCKFPIPLIDQICGISHLWRSLGGNSTDLAPIWHETFVAAAGPFYFTKLYRCIYFWVHQLATLRCCNAQLLAQDDHSPQQIRVMHPRIRTDIAHTCARGPTCEIASLTLVSGGLSSVSCLDSSWFCASSSTPSRWIHFFWWGVLVGCSSLFDLPVSPPCPWRRWFLFLKTGHLYDKPRRSRRSEDTAGR
jgi:hypothetical protein